MGRRSAEYILRWADSRLRMTCHCYGGHEDSLYPALCPVHTCIHVLGHLTELLECKSHLHPFMPRAGMKHSPHGFALKIKWEGKCGSVSKESTGWFPCVKNVIAPSHKCCVGYIGTLSLERSQSESSPASGISHTHLDHRRPHPVQRRAMPLLDVTA